MKKENPKLQSNNDTGQKYYFYSEFDLARIIMLQANGKVAASVLTFINTSVKLKNYSNSNLKNKFACPYTTIVNLTGHNKKSISRAVNSLVKDKVFLKNADGSLSWNLQGIDLVFDQHRKKSEHKEKTKIKATQIKAEKTIINPLQIIANETYNRN